MTDADPAFILTDLDHTFTYPDVDPGPEELERLIRVLHVTCRHRNFALRTAALLAVQRPDATALFTLADWFDWGMDPVRGVPPLVAVAPKGKLSFVYDFIDVEPRDPDDEMDAWRFILDNFCTDVELPFAEDDHEDVMDRLTDSAHLDGIQIAPQYSRLPATSYPPLRVDTTADYQCDVVTEEAIRSYARFFVVADPVDDAPAERLENLLSGWAHVLLGHLGPCADESTVTRAHSAAMGLARHTQRVEVETVLALFTSRSGVELVSAQRAEASLIEAYANHGWPHGYRLDRCVWAAERLLDHTHYVLEPRTTFTDEHYLPGLFDSADAHLPEVDSPA